MFCGINSWAQQSDSTRFSLKTRPKPSSKIPEIKANIQPYKPLYNHVTSSTSMFDAYSGTNTKTVSASPKDKLLTIVKIYPNPVEDQLNIILSLNKDTQVTIKIIDLLGNEVVTLANERFTSGEQTKSFIVPSRLNAGIYFLRVVAGAEYQVKRISVL
ncbi:MULTISPECIES: T9SS type A sorting domain-containing protein [unclassified Pedobacter]|uniref:T9SS type A sorting domain-containing protein n=1 Tax=unclassified Pedobacter TaxID=2628915 RepID=UPI001E609D67|nr:MULTISPECIES: T9SS type A sorting domain-containing protein [unclassified Pedobacter]